MLHGCSFKKSLHVRRVRINASIRLPLCMLMTHSVPAITLGTNPRCRSTVWMCSWSLTRRPCLVSYAVPITSLVHQSMPSNHHFKSIIHCNVIFSFSLSLCVCVCVCADFGAKLLLSPANRSAEDWLTRGCGMHKICFAISLEHLFKVSLRSENAPIFKSIS